MTTDHRRLCRTSLAIHDAAWTSSPHLRAQVQGSRGREGGVAEGRRRLRRGGKGGVGGGYRLSCKELARVAREVATWTR